MEYEVKRIPIAPLVKVMFFVFMVVGFIGGIFYGFLLTSLISTMGKLFLGEEELLREFSSFGAIGIIIMGIVAAIFSSVIMSILTAIAVACYNLFAGWLGGFKLELASKELDQALYLEEEEDV